MRRGLVVLLVVLGACESRYGAYLMVKGDLEFDEVELYFGIDVDPTVAPGNAFASPTFGAQQGTIFDRTYDASDVATLPAPATQTTYYLPADPRNQEIGSYVVAVALSGGKPVGIAEYFGFKVPSDEVHEYHLELTPWDPSKMDRWGDRPGCVTWKQPREGRDPIVAVVHDDDRDCDALTQDVDCSDVCSAQSPACSSDRVFCNVTGVCALGCSRSGLCAPTLCLPPPTCSSLCNTKPTLGERLACGAANTNVHVEVFVHRSDSNIQCANEFTFSASVPCRTPRVEAVSGAAPGVQYEVRGDSPVATCTLTVTPAGAVLADGVKHHVLLSLEPQVLGPRISFVVGVQGSGVTGQGCATPAYQVQIPDPVPLYDCK